MVFIRFGLLLSLWFCPYYFLAGCFRGFEKIRDGQNYSKDFNQAVIALTIVCVFLSFYLLDPMFLLPPLTQCFQGHISW